MELDMALKTIVSYDDTLNDHDGLALARVLADAGAEITLAYVRHTTRSERAREELEEHEAEALLERGARWLGDLDVERRVVVHASTGEGLRFLADHEEADLVIFGSDYRTAAGHVAPQRSAQRLLDGGRAAVAIAPANYRSGRDVQIHTIGVLAGPDDRAAVDTAHSLADRLGATVSAKTYGVDVLIVGSRPEAADGRVMISSQAENAVDQATCPVLVIARGVALDFASAIYIS
jgi:nucleotide-binding universal stress UspA family protein